MRSFSKQRSAKDDVVMQDANMPPSPAQCGLVGTSEQKRQAPQRLEWPDRAKGVGIILVVFGHVWRGLMEAGLPIDGALFRAVDGLVYAFHMPLFFFLSGLFFHDQLVRKTAVQMLRSRIVLLLWPLAVWTWIFFSFKALAGQFANSPVGLNEFPLIPLPPRDQFWFLWALFLVQLALLPVAPLARRPALADTVWLIIGFLSVGLYFLRPGVAAHGEWLVGAYSHAPYFVLGTIFGKWRQYFGLWLPSWCGVTGFLIFESLALWLPDAQTISLIVGAGAVLSLVLVMRTSEHWRGSGTRLGWLDFLGEQSLAIYVAHVIFAAAVRIVLLRFGIEDVSTHVVLGVLAGVIGPLLIARVLRRVGAAQIFGLRSV